VPTARDPSREWRGWQTTADEFARIVRDAAGKAEDDGRGGRKLFIIARDERLASILNFYLPPNLPVRRPTPGHPLVHVVESALIENAYHTWPRYDARHDGRSRFAGCAALFVTDNTRRDDPPPHITRAFASCRTAALFDVHSDGEPLRRIRVFACFNYTGMPGLPNAP
jgi:hypothetical protein